MFNLDQKHKINFANIKDINDKLKISSFVGWLYDVIGDGNTIDAHYERYNRDGVKFDLDDDNVDLDIVDVT